MKKYYRVCTGIVAYRGDKLHSVSVVTKQGDLIRLFEAKKDAKSTWQFDSFYKMYELVLQVMRNNGFRPKYFDFCGARIYNIVWYDILDPTFHSKHGLPLK